MSYASEIKDLEPEIGPGNVGFAELEDHHCRWPVDGQGYQIMFCGADALESHPYCRRHCFMAYQPPGLRKPFVQGKVT